MFALIVNPAAGRGRAGDVVVAVRGIATADPWGMRVVVTPAG